jgi:hypothetical protein
MVDKIAEFLLSSMARIPGWLVDEDSPQFMLIRTIFALLLIVAIVYIIALLPLRSWIGQFARRLMRMFTPR